MIVLQVPACVESAPSASNQFIEKSKQGPEKPKQRVEITMKQIRLIAETDADAIKWLKAIACSHQRAGGTLKFDFVDTSTITSPETLVCDYDGSNEDMRQRQVEEVFLSALKDCMQLPDILRSCDQLVSTLLSVCEIASKRMPPREDIARFMIREWNQRIFDTISPYLRMEVIGSRKNEHLLVPWVRWYEDQISNVKVGRLIVESCVKKSSFLSHLEGFKTLQQDWPQKEDYVVMESHKRRVLLCDGVIYFFKTHDNTKWKTCLRLTQVREIGRSAAKSKGITITDMHGTLLKFKCETEDETAQWLSLLQSCIRPTSLDPHDQRPHVEKVKPAVCEAVYRFGMSSKEELEEWMQQRVLAVFTKQGVSLADMTELLSRADLFSDELVEICDDLRNTSPYRQEVFDFYSKAFTTRMHDVLANFLKTDGPNSDEWTQFMTLRLITWIEKYNQILEQCGITPPEGKRIEELPEVAECVLEYISNTSEELRTRLDNIIAADLSSGVIEGPDGTLQTPAPVDMFQMLNAQLELVVPTASQQMILQSIKNCLPMLLHFQQNLLANFEAKNTDLVYTCAIANNCTTSLRYLEALQDNLQHILRPELCAQVDFESVESGFHEVMNMASDSLVTLVYEDVAPYVLALFERAWFEGQDPISQLVAETTTKYKNLSQYLEGRLYRKVSKGFAFKLIFVCLEKLIVCKKAKKIDESFAVRAHNDLNKVCDILASHHRDHSVRLRIKLLRETIEMIVCSHADVHKHFQFLVKASDASIAVAEKILLNRVDLDKTSRSEVIARCIAEEESSRNSERSSVEADAVAATSSTEKPTINIADSAFGDDKIPTVVIFSQMQNEVGAFPFGAEEELKLEKKSSLFGRLLLDSPPMSPKVMGSSLDTPKKGVLSRVRNAMGRERSNSLSGSGSSKQLLVAD